MPTPLITLALTLLAAGEIQEVKTVVFVCEHGSAKSVVAAAHFNSLAEKRGLPWRAVSRGTDPDAEMAPAALRGLKEDGLPEPQGKPVALSQADLDAAEAVVTFALDLPKDLHPESPAARWEVPPVSTSYADSRAAMVKLIEEMIAKLEARP